MAWYLVWLESPDDFGGYDTEDLDLAICVEAPDTSVAETLARHTASAIDFYMDGGPRNGLHPPEPDSYRLCRIAEAEVKVK